VNDRNDDAPRSLSSASSTQPPPVNDPGGLLPESSLETREPVEVGRPLPWPLLLGSVMLLGWGAAYLASFGSLGDPRAGDSRTVQPAPTTVADGAAVYSAACAACHQANGKGLYPAFPPLEGSEWLAQSPLSIGEMVLRGLQGPIEVRGKAYNGVMPAVGQNLSDAELAAVLNVVSKRWGPTPWDLKASDIRALRAKAEGAPAVAGGAALRKLDGGDA
jgi:mono/diheme cytochrome c family protein